MKISIPANEYLGSSSTATGRANPAGKSCRPKKSQAYDEDTHASPPLCFNTMGSQILPTAQISISTTDLRPFDFTFRPWILDLNSSQHLRFRF